MLHVLPMDAVYKVIPQNAADCFDRDKNNGMKRLKALKRMF